MKFSTIALALAFLLAGISGLCEADIVKHTSIGTLSQVQGTNSEGLDGAIFTFSAWYDISDTYTSIGGFPALVGINPTVTISGAAVGANNGTFSSNNGSAFFPTIAGTRSQTFGFLDITLGTGTTALINLPYAAPTATGSGKTIGDMPELSDFVPASLLGANLQTPASDSIYFLQNTSVNAAVPEPGPVVVLGFGVLCACRFRRYSPS